MAEYSATIQWERKKDEAFTDNRFSRAHTWRFDGGAVVPASSSPHVVRAPLSDPRAVDPEEALVAALASCHMLFFLALSARKGFTVESYADDAVGRMAKDKDGREWMSNVTLSPRIVFGGEKRPTAADVHDLHHRAHAACYIANTVKTEIKIVERNDGLASD
jgi:organic hydroperoxide reductase OsmC/OhrA